MRTLIACLFYAAMAAGGGVLLTSASLVSEGERALSRLESPEEKTDTLVKDWLETLSLGYYTGASDKAQLRRRLEDDAGYHRERVNLASVGIAMTGAVFLAWTWLDVRRRLPHAPRRFLLHLHGVACVFLAVGLLAPMLTVVAQREMAVLGNVVLQFEAKSILGTVRDLYARGSVFVAILLALFSVVVPVSKLAVSLLALVAPGAAARAACVRFVRAVGKWSMTDVFVVAVLLAFLATSGNGLTDARLGPGLYFFAAYGLLSIAGGLALARPAAEPARRPLPPGAA